MSYKCREDLTKEEVEDLKSVLRYEPETGNFYWLKTVNSRAVKNTLAGYNPDNNYRTINYNKVRYRQHRLVFLFMTGKFPKDQVDHKNRIKSDNQWCNLREASRSENMQNVNSHKNSTSKYIGVSYDKINNKYRAKIRHNNSHISIGRFKTEIEAAIAYDKICKDLRGDFALLNFANEGTARLAGDTV